MSAPAIVIPAGRRVTAGWLLSPLSAIAFWRYEFLLAIPATYMALLVFGLPALRYCFARRWLQWWHALSAGWLAGVVIAVVCLLAMDSYSADMGAPGTLVVLPGYGALVGFLFWLIAIYKNPNFPQRPTSWVALLVVMGALGFVAWTAVGRFAIHEVYGSLVDKPSNGFVLLELSDGSRVRARIMRFLDDRPMPAHGTVGAYSRFSALSGQRLYWISGTCNDPEVGRRHACDFDAASR
jgi:hypothetical protein